MAFINRWSVSVVFIVVLCVCGGGGDVFNEAVYLTYIPIYHKVLLLVKIDCEMTLESDPGRN